MKLFLSFSLLPYHVNQSVPLTDISSSPIFHGCVNERLADRTPSPTFSTADSDITELADEQQDEMEDFDDEAFVDDTSSDAGTEEGSDLFNDGHDPFYDRSPWFILVGRLVRLILKMTPQGLAVCCQNTAKQFRLSFSSQKEDSGCCLTSTQWHFLILN